MNQEELDMGRKITIYFLCMSLLLIYSTKIFAVIVNQTSSMQSTSLINSTSSDDSVQKNLKQTLNQVYSKYKNLTEGKNADYIPELAKINPHLFGIAIATIDGKLTAIGDADFPFAIESIAKPFMYALALMDNGEALITKKVGLNATGMPFNSIMAIELRPNHLQNPLVNAGAIQVTSFVKGKNKEEKWERALNFLRKLSDGKLFLGMPVYQSETATNLRNRAITELLNSYGMMNDDISDALDRYTKACSVMVSAKQLALMGATLANGGIHPITHERILSSQYARDTLSEMTINGLYENSGAWWWSAGIPAKSGVGGGILAVVPHKMAIVVFSPPLDESGNSVRAQKVIQDLSEQLKLHLLENS